MVLFGDWGCQNEYQSLCSRSGREIQRLRSMSNSWILYVEWSCCILADNAFLCFVLVCVSVYPLGWNGLIKYNGPVNV